MVSPPVRPCRGKRAFLYECWRGQISLYKTHIFQNLSMTMHPIPLRNTQLDLIYVPKITYNFAPTPFLQTCTSPCPSTGKNSLFNFFFSTFPVTVFGSSGTTRNIVGILYPANFDRRSSRRDWRVRGCVSWKPQCVSSVKETNWIGLKRRYVVVLCWRKGCERVEIGKVG